MSLKLGGNWKRVVKWVALGIVGVFILVFFVRVATWESDYYARMAGSERATVGEVEEEEEELIEEEPTEEEVAEWIVAADRPRYLSIEKLGIVNARVLPVRINASGELGTPANIFDVGWYESSGKPGLKDSTAIVIDGHNGGPHVHGVFKDLPSLASGDVIVIERGDGQIFRYEVVENTEVSLDESDVYMNTAMRPAVLGEEGLTLISCTGEWSQSRRTYLSRQFVRAILIKN